MSSRLRTHTPAAGKAALLACAAAWVLAHPPEARADAVPSGLQSFDLSAEYPAASAPPVIDTATLSNPIMVVGVAEAPSSKADLSHIAVANTSIGFGGMTDLVGVGASVRGVHDVPGFMSAHALGRSITDWRVVSTSPGPSPATVPVTVGLGINDALEVSLGAGTPPPGGDANVNVTARLTVLTEGAPPLLLFEASAGLEEFLSNGFAAFALVASDIWAGSFHLAPPRHAGRDAQQFLIYSTDFNSAFSVPPDQDFAIQFELEADAFGSTAALEVAALSRLDGVVTLSSPAPGVMIEAVTVPEPSALALLGLGGAGLVAWRRRREVSDG